MKAVVIGGTGFVGRAICAQFHARGYEVVSVNRRVTSRPNIRDTIVDVTDPLETTAFLDAEQPVAVVNAAGAVWDCTEDQMNYLNTALVRHLLTAVSRSRHPIRFIQLGSVHEYGLQAADTHLRESTTPRPNTPYGCSKLAATRDVIDATRSGKVHGTVLRLTNVVGPGAPVASLPGRVAAELARAQRTGERACLALSPLRAQRDFIDVRDAAVAALRAVDADAVGRIINVGCGRPAPVSSIVDFLISISGVPTDIRQDATEETIRSAQLDWQHVDTALARTVLGWRPRRTLSGSLRDLWISVRAGGSPRSRRLL